MWVDALHNTLGLVGHLARYPAPLACQKPVHSYSQASSPLQPSKTQAHMANADSPAAAPPPPDQHVDDKEDDATLPLLFAESPGEHASLLVSASASHQDQESHLIYVSPSLRLNVTLAEDTGRNGSLFAFSERQRHASSLPGRQH